MSPHEFLRTSNGTDIGRDIGDTSLTTVAHEAHLECRKGSS